MLHRVILGMAIAALSCAAVLLGAVAFLESRWAEPLIAEWAGTWLERTVALDTLGIEAAWPPRVTLRRLRVGNPEWAASPTFLEAEGLSATFRIDRLLHGAVMMPRLRVERLGADLERDGRRATWRLAELGGRLAVGELRVGHARVHYRDRAGRTALLIDATGSAGAADGSIAARVTGALHGTAIRAELTAASVPLAGDQVVPVSFDGALGNARASGSGKVRATRDGLRGLDLQVKAAGASLRHLSGLLEVDLPETPPWRLEGRVHFNGERWTFDPFRASLGASDVSGAWSHEQRGGRRYLRARLQVNVLDLASVRETPFERAGPVIRRRGWDSVRADLGLTVAALRHAGAVPIDSVAMHARLEDSLLRLDPLTLVMAGGRVEGRAVIDPARFPPPGAGGPWPMQVSSSLTRHREAVARISSFLVRALRGTVTGAAGDGSPRDTALKLSNRW